jgi:hypothetical protein
MARLPHTTPGRAGAQEPAAKPIARDRWLDSAPTIRSELGRLGARADLVADSIQFIIEDVTYAFW